MKTKQNMLMKGALTLSMIVMVAFVTMGVKRNTLPANTEPSAKATGVFFSDNFETGNLSKSENGFAWSTANKVLVSSTPNGTMGLKFVYGPNGLKEDSWKEQRFYLGTNYSDLWIKYDLFVPENFHHRCPVKYELENGEENMVPGDTVYKVDQNGTNTNTNNWGIVYANSGDSVWIDYLPDYYLFLDGNYMKNKRTGTQLKIKKRLGYTANNKFILIWQGAYGSTSTGNSIDLEYWSRDRGNSCLSYYLSVDQGAKLRDLGHTESKEFIIEKDKDAGKWMELIYHFKIASSADNDGIIHILKNGNDYLNVRNIGNHSDLGNNYFEHGYFLGYSNSGYKEQTIFYIDNVVFSTDSISSEIAGIKNVLDKDQPSVKLFPNPASTTLTISGGSALCEKGKIELYTLQGTKIHQTTQDVFFPYQVDVSAYEPGLYFLRVIMDGKCFTQKVVKE